MTRDLLADGVCGQGHRIDGPLDLIEGRCSTCAREMASELAALRQASAERRGTWRPR